MESKQKNNREKVGKNNPPKANRFKKGDSTRNPNGRPPKLLKEINEELKLKGIESVKPSQLIEAFELLLNLDEATIKEIVLDITKPFFLRMIGKKLLSSKGDEILEKIIDRVAGKTKIFVDHSTLGEKINMPILDIPRGLSLKQWNKTYSSDQPEGK